MSSNLKRSSLEMIEDVIPSKRSASNWIEDMSAPKTCSPSKCLNRMKVNLRIRPLTKREESSGSKLTVDVVDQQMLVFDPIDQNQEYVYHGRKYKEIGRRPNKNLQFVFDRVFDESYSNIQVYEESTKSFVKALLSGYNCAVFAYGATGSGKTHTMLGSNDDPGVIFFTTMDLFRQLKEKSEDENLELSISYFEIYNEVVFDLLDPTSGKALVVREDSHRGVIVNNLSVHQPKDANHLLEMLEYGNRNRTQHPTDANAESSRSHAIFQISLKKQDFSSTQEMSIQISKMSLIDLAGSERATVAYKSNRSKGLQREGGNINKSLLALGNCITALASVDPKRKTSYIPYRGSKLTLLLRDSLGGNCQTAMIATISPSSFHYEETHNTLVYADRAKGIQLNLRRNSFSVGLQPRNYNHLIESLNRKNVEQTDQILALKQENERLRSQIDKVPDNPIVANCDSSQKLNAVKNSLEILFENRLEFRRQLMECESNLKKIDLRLLFRRYDIERHKMMASDEFEMGVLNNNDPLQALYNQKLHFSDQKSSLELKVQENESKIKRIETELREKTNPQDWLIDTFFNNHNMNAEFKDKSFAERHSMEIAKEILARLDTNEEIMTESVKLNRHAYHCLNGMGRLSEELGSAFTALLRKVEGKKSVVWRDDIASPKMCKRKEVENIFTMPTYSALPKTPLENTPRALVSIYNITPCSFSSHLTPEKSTPLKPFNGMSNCLTSSLNKSSKVAVVSANMRSPAFSSGAIADENDPMNGTFTIENGRTTPSPNPHSANRDYWRGGSQSQRYNTKNGYNPYNREGTANKFKNRNAYQSPRSTNKFENQWNRETNYSSHRNNGYNSSNRHYRGNSNKSLNDTKPQYLPRFRF